MIKLILVHSCHLSQKMPQIKAISFDLDDTLWDNSVVIERAMKKLYQQMLQSYPIIENNFNLQSFIQLSQEMSLQFSQLKETRCDLSKLRQLHIRHVLVESCCPFDKVELFFNHYYFWRNQVTLFAGAEKLLKYLAQSYSLIGISNGNANIDMIGIGNYFQFSICAADVGEKKPGNKLYLMAANKLKIALENIVHIGDDFEGDRVDAKINSL